MSRRDALTGSIVALTIVAAPGLAGMLGQAVTGVPDLPPAVSTPAQVGEAAPVWTKPRTPMREASRSRQPARTGTLNHSDIGTLRWDLLAQCESSNNPRAVSPSGKYRGAFQFDLPTWRSVGMRGDPITHTYAQQLAAAQRLHARRGARPWPECGRFLR